MPHIVYEDRTTHYLVIADYCGSPRHAELTEAEWEAEFSSDPGYAAMREAYPDAVAGIRPVGVGKWKPDWATPYVDPFVRLVLSSDAPADFDDMPAVIADGIAKHTITIKKVDQDGNDVLSGSEPLQIVASSGIPISNSNPSLIDGSVTVEIGPAGNASNVTIFVHDPTKVIGSGQIAVRFKNSPFSMLPKMDQFTGDGAGTVFTLSATPYPNSLAIFKGGILQNPGPGNDYTVDGRIVSFASPPASGVIIVCSYIA